MAGRSTGSLDRNVNIFTSSKVVSTAPDGIPPEALTALGESLKADGAWSVTFRNGGLEFGEIEVPKHRFLVSGGRIEIANEEQIRISVTTSWLNLALPYFGAAVILAPRMFYPNIYPGIVYFGGFCLIAPMIYFLICRSLAWKCIANRTLGAIATYRIVAAKGDHQAGRSVAV